MVRYLFIFSLIIFISCASTPIQKKDVKIVNNNKILWSPINKLKWIDFKGVVEPNRENVDAETQCEIAILNVQLINDLPMIKIGTFFIKNKSWTKTDNLSTLIHEQIHFDIYELYSRKIRRKFHDLNKNNISDVTVYQKRYEDLIGEAVKMNEKYDNEVYFNNDKQKLWITNITKEIQELSQFKYVEIDNGTD